MGTPSPKGIKDVRQVPESDSLAASAARPSVVAIVVTHNRPELLCECLESLLSQTHPVAHILVVDNASRVAAAEQLRKVGLSSNPKIEVLRLGQNLGGAGGFAAGIKNVIEKDYDWCWLLDDDVFVQESCLETLLKFSRANVLMPARISKPFCNYQLPAISFDLRTPFARFQKRRKVFAFSDDRLHGALPSYEVEDFCFEGVLMRFDVIRRAGLPRADFFINCDDFEYALRLRYKLREKILFIPGARIQRRAANQVTDLRFRLRGDGTPAWRTYYANRNLILLHMLYGENGAVRISPVLNDICKLLIRLCAVEWATTSAAFWAIVDGVRLKTPQRFLP
jgi:rhamnopyranosyl-N-acetylglucosaminyl-diphospho-decaprenol beta-1,3/1,4-galactofuranosyltransferase